jgi:ribosomal-protein-alanine N-acetyltransferase
MSASARPSAPPVAASATMRIRAMRPVDLPLVYALEVMGQEVPWSKSYFRRVLRQGASCWVLERDGEIFGFGIVSFIDEWAHIMNMAVAPAYRRRGLGRRILLHLLRVAKQHGCRRVFLEVRPTNQAAVALYRQLRFHFRAIQKHYYPTRGRRQDALILARSLRFYVSPG